MKAGFTPDDQDKLANTLLALIEDLVTELRTDNTRGLVLGLDSSLDDDLGLDSLARVELISRIERHFHVSLPQHAFAEAESPRDLLRSIINAQGRRETNFTRQVVERTPGKVGELPHHAATLVEVLEWHLQHNPERLHINILGDDNDVEGLTYRQLWQGAQQVAAGLQQSGVQSGETVAIMLPTGRDYFFSFFGILLTGAVPVPIYPPVRRSQLEDHLHRHGGILNNCAATLLITMPEAKVVARLLKSRVLSLREVVTVKDLGSVSSPYLRPSISADDIAFLQYTSGSTGNPKGVVLTHNNLLANIRAMGEAVAATSDDVFVSWLPLYHDMGLIGAWLGSMYFAVLLVVMSPLSFLSRPERWLWAIHRYRGSLSAAPNFGFEFCLLRLEDDAIDGLDLSSWRLAFNGAEPVSAESIDGFINRFEAFGFKAEAMMPVYGLAESSVGLAFPPLHRKPLIDRIKRDEFSQSGQAIPARPGDRTALQFVGCGHALSGHQIRIVDSDGKDLPERQQGGLLFRGPSTTSGYYRNPQATRALFAGDWLDSGDLAYIAEGEVFITGRNKDVIIRAGRNIYPPEVEEAVGNIDGIRKGCVVAFAARDRHYSTERLVILAETRVTDQETQRALKSRISEISSDLIGLPPDEVIIAPPHTVLKTSSGKVRRSACRELYEQNKLGQAPRSFWLQVMRTAMKSALPLAQRLLHALIRGAYAVYAWTLFLILAGVTWLSAMLLPTLEWRWRAARGLARLLFLAAGVKIIVNGLEKLPPESQISVFVANHSSYLDSIAVVASIPRNFSFVAKHELSRNLFTGAALKRVNTKFVERFDKLQSIQDARKIGSAEHLTQSLFFYPEGTFTRISGLQNFHMGAFVTAATTGMAVVPIAIRGTRSMLRPGTWMPRRGQITFTVGQAINPDVGVETASGDSWAAAVNLREAAQRHILAHCGEVDLSYKSTRA
ncbi:MAG: AMP-binding protein [Gammaproteobacteria bacterium]|nr:AMP-binding protein [Gammaproteobacteria bacterium]